MVMRPGNPAQARGRRASLTAELVFAMGLVAVTLIPLSFGFVHEQKLARAYYYRALAMEVVDGEMEALRAGRFRAFAPGRHPYPIRGQAATHLPSGQSWLTLQDGSVRLEWVPAGRNHGGKVVREARLP